MKLEDLAVLHRVLSEAIEELGSDGQSVYSLTAKVEGTNGGRWFVTVDNQGRITSARQS